LAAPHPPQRTNRREASTTAMLQTSLRGVRALSNISNSDGATGEGHDAHRQYEQIATATFTVFGEATLQANR